MIPVQLLVFAVLTAVTTIVCIAEYLSWEHLTVADKVNLGYLYVPYLALCTFSFLIARSLDSLYYIYFTRSIGVERVCRESKRHSGIRTLFIDCGRCSLMVSRGNADDHTQRCSWELICLDGYRIDWCLSDLSIDGRLEPLSSGDT